MEDVFASNKSLHYSRQNFNVNSCGHPWLLIRDKRKDGRIIFFNFIEHRYYLVTIPNSSNISLWFCGNNTNGWLFFENNDKSGHNFLFNLISMKTLQLPPLREIYRLKKSCIVTASPTDPNCKVIIIESCTDHLFLWQPGQDQFVKQTIKFDVDEFNIIVAATSFKGMIYAFISDHGLAKANYENPGHFQILWTGLPIQTPSVCNSLFYLVELDGELLFIYQPMMGDGRDGVLDFIIYKANFEDMKWVKVDNIGDNAIFLNQHHGFASTAKGSNIKRNSIYFTLPMDTDFYIFNLQDKSLTVLPTCTDISMCPSQLSWVIIPCEN